MREKGSFNESLSQKKSRGWNAKGQFTPAGSWNTRLYLRQFIGLYWDVVLPGSRSLNIVGSGAIIINWGSGSSYQVTFESLIYTTVYANIGRYDLVIKGDVHLITKFSNAGYPSLCGSVKGLSNLKSLTELELVGGRFTGELSVADCPLTRLSLPGSPVSGDFTTLPATLTEIDLSGATGVTGELATLARFAGLRVLNLSGSGVHFDDHWGPEWPHWADGIRILVADLSFSELDVVYFIEYCYMTDLTGGFLDIAGNNAALSDENLHYAEELRATYGWTVYCHPMRVGIPWYGGIIACIFVEGDAGYVEGETHGIIITPTDMAPTAWSNVVDSFSGAQRVEVGAGGSNTDLILAQAGHTGSAAKCCRDYLSPDGFNDFSLPTPEDWLRIEANAAVIGGFTHPAYWSSAESDDYGSEYAAYIFYFPYDIWPSYYDTEWKSEARSFRPIRYF
jgi:hypothetical protein